MSPFLVKRFFQIRIKKY